MAARTPYRERIFVPDVENSFPSPNRHGRNRQTLDDPEGK